MRCLRMRATIYHSVCLFYQQFYTYLGQPCANCPQGEKVRYGLYNDEDIAKIKKICENENKIVRNGIGGV